MKRINCGVFSYIFVNVKESEIIVYHQSKIVLHEQEGLWCFFVHFLLI